MIRHNPRSSSATVASINRRGFSLIEAAIVLAVVGGVIGAIWVGAANMIENHKVNKTVEALVLIMDKVRTVNKGFVPNNFAPIDESYGLTELIYASDGIPSNAFSDCRTETTFFRCKSLWNSDFTIMARARNSPAEIALTGEYSINLGIIPKSACIKLGMKLADLDFSSLKIRRVGIGVSAYISPSLMTLGALTSSCAIPNFGVVFTP